MTKKKDLIILIPGAKFAKSVIKPLQSIVLFFYNLTHIYHPLYYNYINTWKKEFKDVGKDSIWLHWERGITIISKRFAVERLSRIIKRYHNTRNIKLVGISLGGEIALESLKRFNKGEISKIILVCSTNEQTIMKNNKTSIINIYSPFDIFARISSKILAPIHGGVTLLGENIVNISLPNITHEQFCAGEKILTGSYDGMSITKLVLNKLK